MLRKENYDFCATSRSEILSVLGNSFSHSSLLISWVLAGPVFVEEHVSSLLGSFETVKLLRINSNTS
jgi:hypothetical protein